ncbi:uncharacterized protein HMPREF1541_03498 [Cyphellophora europaea CBS 101466]|uniref:Uncharacterized protein n=1 Tax=Cyphellophora europaea (strain CBS 101466) TaxID=1220924 RepID=W2RYN9_CYPE1|nr:uncharacterized protein HMPREF1541_03498 [Cyphellophora europaea CBS 101466]ETN41562.1 hypothetical protein HMPREF1541_03498 [Cyphellophora europaea CBS 101466]
MATFSLTAEGHGTNYTGMLTRSIVFSGALILFLVTTGLTIASIIVPDWISYDTTTLHWSLGLHRKCSNTNLPPSSDYFFTSSRTECVEFPRYSECRGEDRYFCSMWRSVGFLMSFAVVIEGMTIAAFIILLAGGKQRREAGWGALVVLALISAVVQAISMGLMTYLFDNDDQFFPGWYLDKSWSMCTGSWAVQALCAAAITAAALILPSEGGYELIPDHA